MRGTYYINQNQHPEIPYLTDVGKKQYPELYESGNIEKAGCGICSAAMMLKDLRNREVSLQDLVQLSYASKANLEPGTDMVVFGKALTEKFGLNLVQSDSEEDVIDCIAHGGACIANVGGDHDDHIGVFSSGGHYIYIFDYDPETKLFSILDPSLSEGKFEKEGRKGKVQLKGNIVLTTAEVLAADTANRDPGYYLFYKKPVIGILGGTFMSEPGLFISSEKEYCNADYIHAVLSNGGTPVIIPCEPLRIDPESVLSGVDGVLFPGGEDVDPLLYGEEAEQKCGTVRPEMDEAWKNAYDYAEAHQIPMLGICRGIQFLNVMRGGTLWQDLTDYRPDVLQHVQRYKRSYLHHSVQLEKDSYVQKLFGTESVMTNSMHHQAVKELGRGLKASGHAKDGVIEAMEDEEGLIIAVQWHPEGLTESNPIMNRLFQDLVKRCGKKS
ncbi:hypothetical protein FYJ51_09130 [Erysipelotrichaceae bacterium Oil+RF-744-GAM-WT-6]|uniref:Peptidase C39-like domain-containing protein n=1 Tax=Stecheria intestinalis TaxID=2606630 RepID=A0A7X2TH12_9FIRM|nr:gamma-glutamyl-gamma-aminobutyrate hydrolase family protein [Stecheria intestinalis]MSS59061.1 hypothetical protein [Stecheria intestinalis]